MEDDVDEEHVDVDVRRRPRCAPLVAPRALRRVQQLHPAAGGVASNYVPRRRFSWPRLARGPEPLVLRPAQLRMERRNSWTDADVPLGRPEDVNIAANLESHQQRKWARRGSWPQVGYEQVKNLSAAAIVPPAHMRTQAEKEMDALGTGEGVRMLQGRLVVTCIVGREFVTRNWASTKSEQMDPYIKVGLGEDKDGDGILDVDNLKATKPRPKQLSKAPIDFCNEQLFFDVTEDLQVSKNGETEEDVATSIIVQVLDKEKLADKLLGTCTIPILSIFHRAQLDQPAGCPQAVHMRGWHKMHQTKKQLDGPMPSGSVRLALDFTPARRGLLVVKMLEGRNLTNMDMFNKQDPYCQFRLGKATVRGQTDTDGHKTPDFKGEELELWVDGAVWQNDLIMECWDEDKGLLDSTDDLIGQRAVDLFDIMYQPACEMQTRWWQLSSKGGRDLKGKPAGEIKLGLEFLPAAKLQITCVGFRQVGERLPDLPFVELSVDHGTSTQLKRVVPEMADILLTPRWDNRGTVELEFVNQDDLRVEAFGRGVLNQESQGASVGTFTMSMASVHRMGTHVFKTVSLYHPDLRTGDLTKTGELDLQFVFEEGYPEEDHDGGQYPLRRPDVEVGRTMFDLIEMLEVVDNMVEVFETQHDRSVTDGKFYLGDRYLMPIWREISARRAAELAELEAQHYVTNATSGHGKITALEAAGAHSEELKRWMQIESTFTLKSEGKPLRGRLTATCIQGRGFGAHGVTKYKKFDPFLKLGLGDDKDGDGQLSLDELEMGADDSMRMTKVLKKQLVAHDVDFGHEVITFEVMECEDEAAKFDPYKMVGADGKIPNDPFNKPDKKDKTRTGHVINQGTKVLQRTEVKETHTKDSDMMHGIATSIVVQVWDHETFTDFLLGTGTMSLQPIFHRAQHGKPVGCPEPVHIQEWFPLQRTIPSKCCRKRRVLDSGDAQLALEFLPARRGMLVVKTIRGRKLRSMDTFGKQDPYCKLQIGSITRQGKTDMDGSRTPNFEDEEFEFWIGPATWMEELVVECWDEDEGVFDNTDDLIGRKALKIMPILYGPPGEMVTRWVPLQTNKGKPAGELELGFQFIPAAKLEMTPLRFRKSGEQADYFPFVEFRMDYGKVQPQMHRIASPCEFKDEFSENDDKDTHLEGAMRSIGLKEGKQLAWRDEGTVEVDIVQQDELTIECFDHLPVTMEQGPSIGKFKVSVWSAFRQGVEQKTIPVYTVVNRENHKAGELDVAFKFKRGAPRVGYPTRRADYDKLKRKKKIGADGEEEEDDDIEYGEEVAFGWYQVENLNTTGPHDQFYYCNKETAETRWTRPVDPAFEEMKAKKATEEKRLKEEDETRQYKRQRELLLAMHFGKKELRARLKTRNLRVVGNKTVLLLRLQEAMREDYKAEDRKRLNKEEDAETIKWRRDIELDKVFDLTLEDLSKVLTKRELVLGGTKKKKVDRLRDAIVEDHKEEDRERAHAEEDNGTVVWRRDNDINRLREFDVPRLRKRLKLRGFTYNKGAEPRAAGPRAAVKYKGLRTKGSRKTMLERLIKAIKEDHKTEDRENAVELGDVHLSECQQTEVDANQEVETANEALAEQMEEVRRNKDTSHDGGLTRKEMEVRKKKAKGHAFLIKAAEDNLADAQKTAVESAAATKKAERDVYLAAQDDRETIQWKRDHIRALVLDMKARDIRTELHRRKLRIKGRRRTIIRRLQKAIAEDHMHEDRKFGVATELNDDETVRWKKANEVASVIDFKLPQLQTQLVERSISIRTSCWTPRKTLMRRLQEAIVEQQIRESSLWMHDREKYLSIEEPEDTSSHTDAKTIGDLYPALAPEAIVSEEPAIVNVLFDMLERCCVEHDQWAKEEARLKKAAEYKARHPPPQDKYPSLDPDIVRAQGGEYVNDVVTSLYGVLERCASAVPVDLYPSLSTETDAGTETKSSAADVATNDGVLHSLYDVLEQCFRDEEADQEEAERDLMLSEDRTDDPEREFKALLEKGTQEVTVQVPKGAGPLGITVDTTCHVDEMDLESRAYLAGVRPHMILIAIDGVRCYTLGMKPEWTPFQKMVMQESGGVLLTLLTGARSRREDELQFELSKVDHMAPFMVKAALEERGLDATKGNKKVLGQRLKEAIREEHEAENTRLAEAKSAEENAAQNEKDAAAAEKEAKIKAKAAAVAEANAAATSAAAETTAAEAAIVVAKENITTTTTHADELEWEVADAKEAMDEAPEGSPERAALEKEYLEKKAVFDTATEVKEAAPGEVEKAEEVLKECKRAEKVCAKTVADVLHDQATLDEEHTKVAVAEWEERKQADAALDDDEEKAHGGHLESACETKALEEQLAENSDLTLEQRNIALEQHHLQKDRARRMTRVENLITDYEVEIVIPLKRMDQKLGFKFDGTGQIDSISKKGPAYKAGVRIQMTFMRINGRRVYDHWDADGDGDVDDHFDNALAHLSPGEIMKALRPNSDGDVVLTMLKGQRYRRANEIEDVVDLKKKALKKALEDRFLPSKGGKSKLRRRLREAIAAGHVKTDVDLAEEKRMEAEWEAAFGSDEEEEKGVDYDDFEAAENFEYELEKDEEVTIEITKVPWRRAKGKARHGFTFDQSGMVLDVPKKSRAYKAGLRPKMILMASNGVRCNAPWDRDGDGQVDNDHRMRLKMEPKEMQRLLEPTRKGLITLVVYKGVKWRRYDELVKVGLMKKPELREKIEERGLEARGGLKKLRKMLKDAVTEGHTRFDLDRREYLKNEKWLNSRHEDDRDWREVGDVEVDIEISVPTIKKKVGDQTTKGMNKGKKLNALQEEALEAKQAKERAERKRGPLGFMYDGLGKILSVSADGRAYKAGLLPTMQLLAVNGKDCDGRQNGPEKLLKLNEKRMSDQLKPDGFGIVHLHLLKGLAYRRWQALQDVRLLTKRELWYQLRRRGLKHKGMRSAREARLKEALKADCDQEDFEMDELQAKLTERGLSTRGGRETLDLRLENDIMREMHEHQAKLRAMFVDGGGTRREEEPTRYCERCGDRDWQHTDEQCSNVVLEHLLLQEEELTVRIRQAGKKARLGFSFDGQGQVVHVPKSSRAFRAGMREQMTIMGINGLECNGPKMKLLGPAEVKEALKKTDRTGGVVVDVLKPKILDETGIQFKLLRRALRKRWIRTEGPKDTMVTRLQHQLRIERAARNDAIRMENAALRIQARWRIKKGTIAAHLKEQAQLQKVEYEAAKKKRVTANLARAKHLLSRLKAKQRTDDKATAAAAAAVKALADAKVALVDTKRAEVKATQDVVAAKLARKEFMEAGMKKSGFDSSKLDAAVDEAVTAVSVGHAAIDAGEATVKSKTEAMEKTSIAAMKAEKEMLKAKAAYHASPGVGPEIALVEDKEASFGRDLGFGWYEVENPNRTGKADEVYYVNRKTQETSWDIEAVEVSKQKAHAEHEAKVRREAESAEQESAALKIQYRWRKKQGTVAAHILRVAKSEHIKETKRRKDLAAHQAAAAKRQALTAQENSKHIGDGWYEVLNPKWVRDDDGVQKFYYVHHETKKTSWSRPQLDSPEVRAAKEEHAQREKAALKIQCRWRIKQGGMALHLKKLALRESKNLDHGHRKAMGDDWFEVANSDPKTNAKFKVYYLNQRTKATSWKKPVIVTAGDEKKSAERAEQEKAALKIQCRWRIKKGGMALHLKKLARKEFDAHKNDIAKDKEDLGNGWWKVANPKATTPANKFYYINYQSKQTSWTKPEKGKDGAAAAPKRAGVHKGHGAYVYDYWY